MPTKSGGSHHRQRAAVPPGLVCPMCNHPLQFKGFTRIRPPPLEFRGRSLDRMTTRFDSIPASIDQLLAGSSSLTMSNMSPMQALRESASPRRTRRARSLQGTYLLMPAFSLGTLKFISRPVLVPARFMSVRRCASLIPLISSTAFSSMIRLFSISTSIQATRAPAHDGPR